MANTYKNFAYSTVAIAPSPALSGTTLTVAAGEGADFPAVPFEMGVCPAGVNPRRANAEVVLVTAMAGDAITGMTRGVDGARAIAVGDQCYNLASAAAMAAWTAGVDPASAPTYAGMTLSGLTALRLVCTDGLKALASVALLSAWVLGTANQIVATDTAGGTITLSLPQNIHTGASPTFAGATLTGNLTVSKADPSVIFATPGSDSDYWIGVQDDAGNDDDDLFQIGGGSVPGTTPAMTFKLDGANGYNVGIGTSAPTTSRRLDLVGIQPGIRMEVARDSGGVAFALFDLNATNLTSALSAKFGEIGVSGGLNTAPTPPSVTYMYLGAKSTVAFNDAAIYIDTSDRVGINSATPSALVAQLEVTPETTTTPCVVVKTIASQTAHAYQVRNSAGTVVGFIQANGAAGFNKASGLGGTVHAVALATTLPAIVAQAAASQTANIEEWRDSGAAVVAAIGPAGTILPRAGTATAGTAPQRFTSGPVLTVAVAGTLEFTTDDFFATITTGAARKAFVLDDGTRLTSGRIPIAATNGRLIDDADLTFSGSRLTATDLTVTNAPIVSSLTAGRVVFAGASKELVDDADLTFAADTLTTTKLAVTGLTTFGAAARLKGYTVAGLPAGTQGDTAFVTDALTPTYLTAAVGGGAVVAPVFHNGAAWVTA